jgi:alpha-L-fucosidase
MKFGLFIHWGIYSEMGEGEWVMHTKKIPYDKYKHLADNFNPQAFNAKEWVQFAKNAGMKYITITSRHHDGFQYVWYLRHRPIILLTRRLTKKIH